MKLKSLVFAFCSFCISLMGLCAQPCEEYGSEYISDVLFDFRVEASHSTGQFIGIRQDYSEIGIFAPLLVSDCCFSFLDCRGYRFENARWGSSVGAGLRKSMPDGRVAGANLYYDFLDGKYHKSFNRIGLGLEYFGACFDVRFNAYFPLGYKSNFSDGIIYDDYVGGYYANFYKKEFSIGKGFDLEVGIPFWCWDNFTAYAAIGPYYYTSKSETNYVGGQARIEINYNTLISLQARTSYDHVNRSCIQGQIQVTIPFEHFSGLVDCFVSRLLAQPVHRNGVIFTDTTCKYWWNW